MPQIQLHSKQGRWHTQIALSCLSMNATAAGECDLDDQPAGPGATRAYRAMRALCRLH